MIAAILTPFFFAFSAVSGQRVAMRLGAFRGNCVRLGIACLVLGVLTMGWWPESLAMESFRWFFISGLIGFGLGDVALFLGYERLGSRLTILLNLCLAPMFAIALEWVWLKNGITVLELLCSLMILTGVVLAIRPGQGSRQALQRRGNFWVGVAMAVTAGFGQGCGAVISRKAEEVAAAQGMLANGISAAFQRVFAGLIFALITWAVVAWIRKRQAGPDRPDQGFDRSFAPWVLGAALFGPVIGVSCFQWALQSLESGIVLAITAMTPLIMMPLAAMTEGDRPSRLAIVGAVIAVAGVILLTQIQ